MQSVYSKIPLSPHGHKWTSVAEKAWRTAGDHVVLLASPMILSALPVKLWVNK